MAQPRPRYALEIVAIVESQTNDQATVALGHPLKTARHDAKQIFDGKT